MSQWVQRLRFRRLNQLMAARDYLRGPQDTESRDSPPSFLVECDKALPGRQDEHIHGRLQFIYVKIHEALGVKDKLTIYKDFQELWKNKYRDTVTADMIDELTLQWLENVIDIVEPKLQTAVEAASGAETCSVGAALSSEDIQVVVKPEPQKLLRPRFLN